MSKAQFSILNHTQILNHPANSSVSKQQYSFPKSPRFPKVKVECQHAYYPKPEVKGKRSTSFGYGTKSDFTKGTNIAPAPWNYDKKSEFDKARESKVGKSFGLGREETSQFGHIIPGPLKNPGVGNYNIKRDLNQTSFTMRQRTTEPFIPTFLVGSLARNEAPGPGQYEQEPLINKTGKQIIAKYASSGACYINPGTSRFPPQRDQSPGPQHYNADTGLNGKAKYILSNHKGRGCRVFSLDKRITFTDKFSQSNFAPGPGSYRQPSEFGIYENTQKLLNSTIGFSQAGSIQKGSKHFQTHPDLGQTKI